MEAKKTYFIYVMTDMFFFFLISHEFIDQMKITSQEVRKKRAHFSKHYANTAKCSPPLLITREKYSEYEPALRWFSMLQMHRGGKKKKIKATFACVSQHVTSLRNYSGSRYRPKHVWS